MDEGEVFDNACARLLVQSAILIVDFGSQSESVKGGSVGEILLLRRMVFHFIVLDEVLEPLIPPEL